MEQTQITQQITCPEFHNILWQKQNTPTNCVPTAMRMILRARGSFVNPPDAGPQGVQEGSEAQSMAMYGGFKIVSASQYTQNVAAGRRPATAKRSGGPRSSPSASTRRPDSATRCGTTTTPWSSWGSAR